MDCRKAFCVLHALNHNCRNKHHPKESLRSDTISSPTEYPTAPVPAGHVVEDLETESVNVAGTAFSPSSLTQGKFDQSVLNVGNMLGSAVADVAVDISFMGMEKELKL